MRTARYHVIVDIEGANEHVADRAVVRDFLISMAATVHMTILEGPIVAEGHPDNPGITGFVVVDFSHISVHTFTKYNEVLIDVFSCKPYHAEAVKAACVKVFGSSQSVVREQVVHWG